MTDSNTPVKVDYGSYLACLQAGLGHAGPRFSSDFMRSLFCLASLDDSSPRPYGVLELAEHCVNNPGDLSDAVEWLRPYRESKARAIPGDELSAWLAERGGKPLSTWYADTAAALSGEVGQPNSSEFMKKLLSSAVKEDDQPSVKVTVELTGDLPFTAEEAHDACKHGLNLLFESKKLEIDAELEELDNALDEVQPLKRWKWDLDVVDDDDEDPS